MTNNLNFIKFKREDLPKQRLLFDECFPETKNTEASTVNHYNWKFHQFPKDITSYEYACYLNDILIGYYAAIPYEYKLFDKIVRVGMVCDVMTSVAARGKGIFTKLGNFATEDLEKCDIAFTTGYPIRREVIPGHIKVGWDIVFKLPLYIKFIRFDSLLRSKRLGLLTFLFNSCLHVISFLESLFLKRHNFVFKNSSIEETVSSANFSRFIESWKSENRIALIKDKNFMNWRFGAPGNQYKAITMNKGDQLIGLAIVRSVVQEQIPTLAILDFMVLEEFVAFSTNLIFEIKQHAMLSKDEFIIVMMNSSVYKKYNFLRSLFVRTPFVFKLIIKMFKTNLNKEELYRESNWHLMWIDSDDL